MTIKTESERFFERYLSAQGVAWARVSERDHKHPDYKVEHFEGPCFFEVKEFDDPSVKPVGGFSPCPAIQEKIAQARKQFREYRQHCCALVLWNSKSIYRSLFLDVVASAAFGRFVGCDSGLSSRLRADSPSYKFAGPSELNSAQNTTISAIVILGRFQLNHLWLKMWRILSEKQERGEELTPWLQFQVLEELSLKEEATFSYPGTVRSIVLENPYARIPFPKTLLKGAFDQRWAIKEGALCLLEMGPELISLKESGYLSYSCNGLGSHRLGAIGPQTQALGISCQYDGLMTSSSK